MATSEDKPDILIITVTDIEQTAVIDVFRKQAGNQITHKIGDRAAYVDLGVVVGARGSQP